eukprot:RCo022536
MGNFLETGNSSVGDGVPAFAEEAVSVKELSTIRGSQGYRAQSAGYGAVAPTVDSPEGASAAAPAAFEPTMLLCHRVGPQDTLAGLCLKYSLSGEHDLRPAGPGLLSTGSRGDLSHLPRVLIIVDDRRNAQRLLELSHGAPASTAGPSSTAREGLFPTHRYAEIVDRSRSKDRSSSHSHAPADAHDFDGPFALPCDCFHCTAWRSRRDEESRGEGEEEEEEELCKSEGSAVFSDRHVWVSEAGLKLRQFQYPDGLALWVPFSDLEGWSSTTVAALQGPALVLSRQDFPRVHRALQARRRHHD